jgi:hypothetical protein
MLLARRFYDSNWKSWTFKFNFCKPYTYTTVCWSFFIVNNGGVIDAYVISHNEFVSANMLVMCIHSIKDQLHNARPII